MRRVGPERRQLLEEEGLRQAIAEHGGRERLDRAVAVQQPRRADRTDPFDPRIAVGGVADERQVVGDQGRLDAELGAHAGGVADRLATPVDLDDAVVANALR